MSVKIIMWSSYIAQQRVDVRFHEMEATCYFEDRSDYIPRYSCIYRGRVVISYYNFYR